MFSFRTAGLLATKKFSSYKNGEIRIADLKGQSHDGIISEKSLGITSLTKD